MNEGFKAWLKRTIPNPLDSSITIEETIQKGLLIYYKLWPLKFISNLVGFGVFAGAVWFFLPDNKALFQYIVGWGLVQTVATALVKVFAIREVGTVGLDGKRPSVKSLLLNYEFFDAWDSAVVKLVGAAGLGGLLYLYGPELASKFVPGIELFVDLPYMIGAIVVFSLGDVIANIIDYLLLKGVDENQNYVEVYRQLEIIHSKSQMVSMLPAILGFVLFAYAAGFIQFAGINVIVGVWMAIFALFAWLHVMTIKRLQGAATAVNSEAPINKVQIAFAPGETIQASLFGITPMMNSGFSILGVGKMNKAENSLLITNRRVMLVEVPMPGRNLLLGEQNVQQDNVMFNRADLRNKGEEFVRTKTLDEIEDYATENIPFEDIERAAVKSNMVTFHLRSGKTMSYIFMDAEYADLLKRNLPMANPDGTR